MIVLPFRLEQTPYPPASGLTGAVVQKIREDGRIGPAVGDEWLLWQSLQDALRELHLAQKAAELETRARLRFQTDLEDARAALAEANRHLEQERTARLSAESNLQLEKAVRAADLEALRQERDDLRRHLEENGESQQPTRRRGKQ